VQFPELRIEFEVDGREDVLDVEVLTPHYRRACGGKIERWLRVLWLRWWRARRRPKRCRTGRGVIAMTFDERI
jgi:hypothetical protein